VNQARAFRGVSALNVVEVSPELTKEPLKRTRYQLLLGQECLRGLKNKAGMAGVCGAAGNGGCG